MQGQGRALAAQVDRKPQLLAGFALGGAAAAVPGCGRAAHADVPQVGPAFLEGLPLLDQHAPIFAEDAHMHDQPVKPLRLGRPAHHRAPGFFALGGIQVKEFHLYPPIQIELIMNNDIVKMI